MSAIPSQPLRSALLHLKLQPTLCNPVTAPYSVPSIRHLHTSHTRPVPAQPAKYNASTCVRSFSIQQSIRFATVSTPPTRPATPDHPNVVTTLPPISPPTTREPTTPTPDPTLSYAASVTSRDPSGDDDASTLSTTGPPPPHNTLTWNAYLRLRHIRRRYNQAASLFTALTGAAVGSQVLASQSLETVAVFGLDPLIGLGVGMAGFVGTGWLCGGSIGGAVFGLMYRRQRGEIIAKERDFYRHLVKRRVDPSGSSGSLMVPDYYGEKIGSVQDYRKWLKNQRAFNRRRENPLAKWTTTTTTTT